MTRNTTWVVMGVLALGAPAVAQQPPVNSPTYHAVHNPQSPYYVGPRQQAPAQQAPKPAGYWEKTWGAIAPSPVGGVLGTALGASSKEEAERLALADCEAKGGGACEVNLAYHNQCAVMIVGDNYLTSYSNATIEEATARGLRECGKDNTNCRVYYSACTEPIFHHY